MKRYLAKSRDKTFPSFLPVVRLVIVFVIAFSLANLPSQISGNFSLPIINSVHAIPAPVENWVPAGPAMDTQRDIIFTDESAMQKGIMDVPLIDLTDRPLPPPSSTCPGFNCYLNQYVTSPIASSGYVDIQFMLANNFWGCLFSFGNSNCGIEIRQGIAHLIDRAKFAANESSIAGQATPVDNPVSPNSGGLPPVNPCNWDLSFPQTGSKCASGASGGLAFHLANATGANGYAWLPGPGSPDLCAAAQHFINAGIATGHDANCVLTGISSTASQYAPNFTIRSDNPTRLHLGDSLSSEICDLFTGSYSPCQYLTVNRCPITCFPGFTTSPGNVNLSWGMYIGGFTGGPFDSLYFTYNSRFVSGNSAIQQPTGPCSPDSVPSYGAPDYMYLCNAAFDSASFQIESAPCLDSGPALTCPGTNQLSAVRAGMQAEDIYGRGAYSIPLFTGSYQYAYLKNWQRVINGIQGIPNYFTWLDAYSPNPALPGAVRQGFSQNTHSVNPYIASSLWDGFVLFNVYDTLSTVNPMGGSQLLNWMSVNTQQLASLTYTPPRGTVSTFRFILRSDLFFQDGRKVTSFDAAFSYLSSLTTGDFVGAYASSVIGITILGPSQFDIHVNSLGPFTLPDISTVVPILAGRYWTNAGRSSWDSSVSSCTSVGAACFPAQYQIGANQLVSCSITCTFPPGLLDVDRAKIVPGFDPIGSGILIGSGPWQCGPSNTVGTGCTSTGAQNPGAGGAYTLTRFGNGIAPASSLSGLYFRSNGNLALWTWSQNTGELTHDFLNFSVVASCFGKLDVQNCIHWMMGIGGCGGTPQSPCQIGLSQISIVNRFVGLNWIAPYDWLHSPPTGIIGFAPVLYEGSVTLNPASVAGCSTAYPNSGYDC